MFNFGGGAGPGNSGMFQGALSRKHCRINC